MSGRESEHHISCSAECERCYFATQKTMDTQGTSSSSAEWLMRKRWLQRQRTGKWKRVNGHIHTYTDRPSSRQPSTIRPTKNEEGNITVMN